jgi:hypothetical protein
VGSGIGGACSIGDRQLANDLSMSTLQGEVVMDPEKPKSDVEAKAAFAAVLRERGYHAVTITDAPADITARRNGEVFYFEIKKTEQKLKYFGAATLTEWEAALSHEGHFFFVVAAKWDGQWVFHEYTPQEFMAFSFIPPFKIFFRVPMGPKKHTGEPGKTGTVKLSRARLLQMIELFRSFQTTE